MGLDITKYLGDGFIDVAETNEIAGIIYADDKIDWAEVEDLFELKDRAAEAGGYCDEFGNLLVRAATDAVLGDPDSPGSIDEEEALFLNGLISGDGKYDDVEKRLITNVRAKATSVHSALMNVA